LPLFTDVPFTVVMTSPPFSRPFPRAARFNAHDDHAVLRAEFFQRNRVRSNSSWKLTPMEPRVTRPLEISWL